MTASTHKKIRKSDKFWVTKINKKGKQSLVAPVVVEDGPVLMASTTVGTQANSSDFLFYKGGYSKNTRMSFIIDTTKNPDNSADKTIIVPFTLYTPSYQFTIDWGDGTSTTYPANASLTTVGLTHTYSTAGQYAIVITSDEQKIPVLNWSTSGNVGGNKYKLIQLSTPLITFDTACPNSNSAQYFAYECDNLLFIATQFFINNPQIRNYDYCFSKCSKLVKLPYDLFKYVKYQSSYQEVFAHDLALQTVPNDLFATAKAIDLGGAFSGDSNLVLDVDLGTFFGTEPYINVDVHDIFRDCVKTTGDAVEFTKKFTEYVAYVIGTGTFDTGWGTLTGKIYAQPIYNSDGKLVRDLVPAKTGNFYGGRIAPQDCLYDEINGEFLLPSSTFTYGTEKDVSDSYVFEGKTGEVGYDVVGNPTIQNGIVSNFSTSDYLTIPAPNLSTANDWEIATKVNVPRLTDSYQVFFTGSANHPFVGVDIDGRGRLVAAIGNSSGNGWQILESSSSWLGTKKTVPLNTDFWTKITFNGSKYSIYYSADGENWEETIYYESTQKIYHDPTNIISIGIGRMHNSFVCSGSIDLKETYIKVNNELWFGNQTQLVSADENVYLQSDGLGQYIQTNIHATGDTEVSTSFSVAQIETLSSIFSSRTSYNNANFGLSSREQGVLTAYYNKSNIDIPNCIVQPNRRIYIDMIKNNISVDNMSYSSIANYASFTASIPLRFFALATSTPSFFLNGKLYRTNIVNGNDKYDFIPVPKGLQIGYYTVPSNGMWDIVEQKFYPNQGTGAFTIGGFTFDNIENNLPYSFKKNALYNCEKWSNFAIPENVWTGTPSSREDWLAVNVGKTNWLLTDSMNMLLLESANSNILCSPTDALKADMEAPLSWYTGTIPEQVQGIIKPEPYESVDSLRNIINALPELRGYIIIGNPTIENSIMSGINDSNYAELAADATDTDIHDYEFGTEVVIPQNPDKTRGHILAYRAGSLEGIAYRSDTNTIRWYIARKDGTATDISINSSLTVSPGDTVLIHCSYLGDKVFQLSVSKDNGITWTNDTVTQGDYNFYSITTTQRFRFGRAMGTTSNYYFSGSINLKKTYIKVNNKVWFDGTEKLNEVLDLSGCVNKGGLTSDDLQKVIDKGYTLVLN